MSNMYFEEAFSKMFSNMMIGYAFIFIPVFIMYSIGLYKMAKNQNLENPWLAWIPVGNYYIVGLLAKDSPFIKRKFKRIEIFTLIAGILYAGILIYSMYISLNSISNMNEYMNSVYSSSYWSTMLISLISSLIALLIRAFMIFTYYHLYKIYSPQEAALYTGLSVFSLTFVFLFVIRNYKRAISKEV